MDDADALEALSNILTRLTDNPYDITLHAENVRFSRETGMEDQIESALEMVTAFWAAGDYVWIPLIEHKLQSSNLESADDLRAVLDLCERAEQDYLSIPLLEKHLDLLIERYEHFGTLDTKPNDLEELFSTEWTQSKMNEVVAKGIGHLTKGHLLWEKQKEWELEVLQTAPPEEKVQLVNRIESMLLERLQQPHAAQDSTFQAYSSFTTSYKPPDQYEALLVSASKLRSQARKAFERREQYETSLEQSGFSLEAYAYYTTVERRKQKPDLFVLKTLYERAIAEADKRRWEGDSTAEDALRSFWISLVDFLRQQGVDDDLQLATFKRAVRSVPAAGEIWARYMRFLERIADSSEDDVRAEIRAVYEKTKTITPLQSDVEQLVPVVLARAGYEKRQFEAGETEQGFDTLIEVVMDGVTRVRKVSPSGDLRLRIEKFFSSVCLKLPDLAEHALILWEDTTKHYKTSYLAWTSYTEVLIKQNLYEDARRVFQDICMKSLDWPEAMWDAWINFEQLYGTVDEIDLCLDKIQYAQAQTNARRAKEAEKAQHAAMQLIAEQQANATSVSEIPPPASTQEEGEVVPMAVDSTKPSGTGAKRKAEDEVASEEHKKQKIAYLLSINIDRLMETIICRDRENCTVFVADLPSDAREDDLASLFKDCGPIREIKVTHLPNAPVATVEFMERESVPAALTKDKKRIHGEEIAVHLAWKSTLYVTNFPEKADDAYIRSLFSKYGTIFDVRWPSKKFKSTRRFCYVQYTSPLAAQAALELHGQELEPSLPLSVYISNPERKKERTDVDANDREVYVAGLSRFVTKEDLENLFKTYGPIKEVRMALDKDERPRGFAFVEFEQEQDAAKALHANNVELKRRRIAVTLADTRVRARNRDPNKRADIRSRSVRVRNLPPNTQEGLLQQALEKLAPLERIEVFADKAEAEVLFENAADVGKLLLRSEPIVYNGNTLELVADTPGATSSSRSAALPPTAGGMFIPRTAVSRPRAGLGSKKRVTTVGATSSAQNGSQSSQHAQSVSAGVQSSKGQDDFRKMLSGGK
ncbi:RNA-binding protein Prp24 [Laetiporus sulphureus 93-53]|uniref:U4/U6 snRNA-associated-splicing factor PRP24 n=1 Tax=Laetiporus sulphureus 93-53 TaxID=1314785 RepID=A0A165FQB6_9APHY|nr:RNA-binding protein Prp24 [Laetiporus sulphureus 93-53]KZT09316.1 RNA-binding protein Prp24 [Laetiporus sulphureus 93-53]